MAKLIKEKGAKGRLHIQSKFMGESLVSKILLNKTGASAYFRIHPEIDAIKIGGQSIIDRDIDSNLPTALQKSVCGRRKIPRTKDKDHENTGTHSQLYL